MQMAILSHHAFDKRNRLPRWHGGLLAICLIIAATSCASRGSHGEVEAILRAQETAWNKADLEGFLAGYAHDEHVVFMGATGSDRGFDAVRDRYRKSYATPAAFGKLSFTGLEFSDIDYETVAIQGQWMLAKPPDDPHGSFMLIMRRFKDGWKIVSDYTTLAPPSR